MSEKVLFLLDGMALAYRGHFALIRNPRLTSKGMNTSAVFAFANTLLSIIERRRANAYRRRLRHTGAYPPAPQIRRVQSPARGDARGSEPSTAVRIPALRGV